MTITCVTDSRIADASRAWQAACNVDVTGWDKASEFILSTWAISDLKNDDADFTLQWRRVGGTFADVAADTEICWGTDTVLTDDAVLNVNNSAGCLAPWDSGRENEGDNACLAVNIAAGTYWEGQWALGFGSGALDDQEYEIQITCTTYSNVATCQTTITTAAGVSAIVKIMSSTLGLSEAEARRAWMNKLTTEIVSLADSLLLNRWLGGWSKRVKLTIDNGDIDAALSDFPVLVYLSISSGRNDDDVSFVFDELQSDDNRKKIAITKADGITECYVEIEKWDHANEKAWLWVKVPDISNIADTDLYLYYDIDHADNPNVGDPNSAAAENVWDGNFKFVSHMKDDPDTSSIRDSTANNNDGAKKGAGEPLEVDSNISRGQDFDGANDYIKIANGELIAQDTITVEIWIEPDVVTHATNHFTIYAQNDNLGGFVTHNLYIDRTSSKLTYDNYLPAGGAIVGNTALSPNTLYHVALVRDTNAVIIYLDSASDGSGTGEARESASDIDETLIGARYYSSAAQMKFDGEMDEVRVSNNARPAAWIKASYESERDDLVDFGTEEILSGAIIKIMTSILGLLETDLYRNRAVRMIAETVDIADSLLRRLWSIRLTAEPIGIVDSLLRKASLIRLIAETVGIAETFVKVTFTTIVKIMAETVGIAEAAVRRMWSIRLKAETVGIADSLVRRLWSIRLFAETLSVQDGFVRLSSSVRQMIETVTIAETFVKALISGIIKIMTETVGIGDAMLKVAGMVRVASETISLSEAAFKRFWSVRIMAETEGISEAVMRRMWSIRQMASMISLSDSVLRVGKSVRQFAETVGINDAMVKVAGMVRVASETVGIAENFVKLTVSTIVKVMVTETVGLSEALVRRLWSVRQIAEKVSLSDSAIRRAWMVRLMASSVALQEGIVRRMWSVKEMANTVGISEAGVLHKWFVKIISETVGLIEGWVKKLTQILRKVDVIEFWAPITKEVDMESHFTREVEFQSEITKEIELDARLK